MYTTAQKLRQSTKQEHHKTKDSISTTSCHVNCGQWQLDTIHASKENKIHTIKQMPNTKENVHISH